METLIDKIGNIAGNLDEASTILFQLITDLRLTEEGQEDNSLTEELENARSFVDAALSKLGGSRYA